MNPSLSTPTCPCGSGAPFERCCGPFLAGAPAPTAETLMRSRYTAYVRGAIDYIVETHDPATRREVDRNTAAGWSREADWLNLSIASVEAGGPGDDEGTVEFVARYRVDGEVKTHREVSRFRKLAGRWYYSSGRIKQQAPARKAPETGRNDPCPCGSGKKYKRCCGA